MAYWRKWFESSLWMGEYLIGLGLIGIFVAGLVLAAVQGIDYQSILGILVILGTGLPYSLFIVWAMAKWIFWSEDYLRTREILAREHESEAAPSSRLRLAVVVVVILLAAHRLTLGKS